MWLVVVASLAVSVIVFFFVIKSRQYKVKDDLFSYKPKDHLLSKTERAVYETLRQIIARNKLQLRVFPKIRLTDFLWSPKDNRNAYLRISGKFVDFLIVGEHSLNPVACIFITNQENKSKMFSLNVIKPAVESAGIELIEISSDVVFDRKKLTEMLSEKLERR